MNVRLPIRLAVGLLAASAPLSAQAIPRDRYYAHIPPMPRLVRQTEASERLRVCGGSASSDIRDVAPLNGVDDSRDSVLLVLAQRFSPVLRRNNFSVPRAITAPLGGHAWVQIDSWKQGRLTESDSVLMGGPVHGQQVRASGTLDDQKLARLLQQFSPYAITSVLEPAEGSIDSVLFIDYPGEEHRSWRRAYRGSKERHGYVHPFIHETGSTDSARYALVLQYWFFYPFNDGANNHEGDWEHLNVVITTAAQQQTDSANAGRVSGSQIERILAGQLPADSLAIARVEYYFHERYVILDYLAALRSPPNRRFHAWAEPDYTNATIRARLRDPRLATHPVGYIGGNNRGPDELTEIVPRFSRGYNRNSHGTYPFPGTWQAVGPLGSTETLSGEAVPVVTGDSAGTLRFDDEHMVTFRAAELTLVPDWECVWPGMQDDPAMRAAWAWLVLPMRWGYPATRSPGAGAIERVDLGNVAPEGPAFQPAWNRLGPGTGLGAYDPRVLRVVLVPTTPWARVRNGWGLLNVPVGLLGFMPGWNIVTEQAVPWITDRLNILGAPPAVTYYPGRPEFRFSASGLGIVHSSGGENFALLLPRAFMQYDTARPVIVGSPFADFSAGGRAWLNVFYGRRFSVENTFSWNTAQLLFEHFAFDTLTADLSGTLDLRELTSGFRMNLRSRNDDVRQLYTRAGWGYTWYELRDIVANGQLLNGSRFDGGYAPTLLPSRRWWPNTWYMGLGGELVSPPRGWPLRRVRLGMRAEYSVSWHAVQPRFESEGRLGWARRDDAALALLVSW